MKEAVGDEIVGRREKRRCQASNVCAGNMTLLEYMNKSESQHINHLISFFFFFSSNHFKIFSVLKLCFS